jgi:GNAT superfamily N-acetyltransferase
MRPEERDEVRALLTEAYQPYEKEIGAVFERYLAGVLNTDEGQTLVAVDGDEVLGSARLYLPTMSGLTRYQPVEWAGPMPADWAWVRSVGVRPSARGTGVAQAIMAHCAAHADGATAILLHTMTFMPAAIRLYERLGYERVPEWDFQGGRAAAASPDEMFLAIAFRLLLPQR